MPSDIPSYKHSYPLSNIPTSPLNIPQPCPFFLQENGDLTPTEAHIDFNILFQFSKAQPIRARIAATKEALRQVELDLARLKAGSTRDAEEEKEGGGDEAV